MPAAGRSGSRPGSAHTPRWPPGRRRLRRRSRSPLRRENGCPSGRGWRSTPRRPAPRPPQSRSVSMPPSTYRSRLTKVPRASNTCAPVIFILYSSSRRPAHVSLAYSLDRAALSATRVTSGWSCRIEAGRWGVTGPFTMPYHRVRLVRAAGHHQDLPGRHDHADAHGQGLAGHLVPGGEEPGVGLDGALGQVHHVGGHHELLAGLVEADVAVAAHAQQLQVGAAQAADKGGRTGRTRPRRPRPGRWARGCTPAARRCGRTGCAA